MVVQANILPEIEGCGNKIEAEVSTGNHGYIMFATFIGLRPLCNGYRMCASDTHKLLAL